MGKRRWWAVLDALSQLLNACLGSGNANQSLSARCYDEQHKLHFRILKGIINAPFRLAGVEDHCYDAYWKDVERAEELVEASKRKRRERQD